jgi:hypothetical protein
VFRQPSVTLRFGVRPIPPKNDMLLSQFGLLIPGHPNGGTRRKPRDHGAQTGSEVQQNPWRVNSSNGSATQASPVKVYRIKPCSLNEREAGGGGRTRTFEAMRRLIYSQLPLPLGTLPRSTASRSASPCGAGGSGHGEVKTAKTLDAGVRGPARLWAKHHGKVNQGHSRNCGQPGPNCQYPEPVTQATP